VRKSQAVHAAGHLDVGEQQRDVGPGFQDWSASTASIGS
jgi:hypothetical protein